MSSPARSVSKVLLFGALLAFSACQDGARTSMSETKPAEIPIELRRARVFFAHQSVGANIIDGIKRLEESAAAQPPIVEITSRSGRGTADPALSESLPEAFIAHAYLGSNGDPKGKTDAFVSTLEGGLARRVDIAFQKYCFVDIDAATNVEELFDYYRRSMTRIQDAFPDLQLVHVTAPLVRVQAGPRAFVKKLLGRTPEFYDDNIARERFNGLMRAEYQARGHLFDLAALEASRPGQSPEPLQHGDQKIFQLRPEYTSDGAHLNGEAEERVAGELLKFLSRLMPAPSTARHTRVVPH